MSIILHPQEPSTTVDLSELTFTETATAIAVGGVAVLHGQRCPVSATFDKADGLMVFLAATGALTTDASQAFAHVAWMEGEDLHAIHHEPMASVQSDPPTDPAK